MELSIIVPVYNVKDYLKRCIESVMKQEYTDYELILVDDGSTDGSGKLCDELAEANDRIRVNHKENGGLSSARNAGLEEAKGKYIMFLDSDDWIEDGCLQKFSKIFPNNYDLIMGKAWTIDDDGKKKEKIAYRIPSGVYAIPDSIAEFTAGEVSFCSQFYIYRAGYVNKHSLRFLDGILHEDELWMPKALLKAETIYVSDVFFYYHYVRKGSIMHSKNYERSAQSTIIVCENLIKEYQKYPDKMTVHLKNRIAMLYMRAVPQLNHPEEAMRIIGRKMPLLYSEPGKQKLKAVIFYLVPRTYCRFVRFLRGY